MTPVGKKRIDVSSWLASSFCSVFVRLRVSMCLKQGSKETRGYCVSGSYSFWRSARAKGKLPNSSWRGKRDLFGGGTITANVTIVPRLLCIKLDKELLISLNLGTCSNELRDAMSLSTLLRQITFNALFERVLRRAKLVYSALILHTDENFIVIW